MPNDLKQKRSVTELLQAGLVGIASVGIDKLTVTEVTEISGVSRPTFYTYFGDVRGFLAEMWLHYGNDWLDYQLDGVAPAAFVRDAQVLEFDQALLEIFVAARRIPELREVVEPDLLAWWTKQTSLAFEAELSLSWKMAVILGAKLSLAVSKKAQLGLAYLDAFSISPSWKTSPAFAHLLDTPKVEFELSPLETGDNTVESHLTSAAIAVIAASGVANASLTRVARRARLSTGSVYPRFKNIDVLIESSFAKVMERLIEANINMAKTRGRSLESYGQIVNAGMLPGRKVWRNFRSEMHLAALHNVELARQLAPAFTAASQQLQAEITRDHVPENYAEAASWLMHDQAIGMSVLYSLLPRIGELDHRVMVLTLKEHLRKLPQNA